MTTVRVAIEFVRYRDHLKVRSPSFASGTAIPQRFTNYGDNVTPELIWSGVPAKTKSFLVIVEDPDVPGGPLFTHWLVYAIKPSVRRLAPGQPSNQGRISAGVQGQNDTGGLGYFGPRPPDTATHHYHFEVFALDETLRPRPGYTREQLLPEMEGHTLAAGEIVGTFVRP